MTNTYFYTYTPFCHPNFDGRIVRLTNEQPMRVQVHDLIQAFKNVSKINAFTILHDLPLKMKNQLPESLNIQYRRNAKHLYRLPNKNGTYTDCNVINAKDAQLMVNALAKLPDDEIRLKAAKDLFLYMERTPKKLILVPGQAPDPQHRAPGQAPDPQHRAPGQAPDPQHRAPGQAPDPQHRAPGQAPDPQHRAPGQAPDPQHRAPGQAPDPQHRAPGEEESDENASIDLLDSDLDEDAEAEEEEEEEEEEDYETFEGDGISSYKKRKYDMMMRSFVVHNKRAKIVKQELANIDMCITIMEKMKHFHENDRKLLKVKLERILKC